uniref:Uncharacterized protein n=1 Tax=viral metagenome TaxID=1070528 RepID=A0A6H1ZFN7_9ZZZZ
MICNRTAERLTRYARGHGLAVQVAVLQERSRRWYSVGYYDGSKWHQCSGSRNPADIERDLAVRVRNKKTR